MKWKSIWALILLGVCGLLSGLAPLPDPTRKILPFTKSEGQIWHANDCRLTKQHEALDWVLPLGPR